MKVGGCEIKKTKKTKKEDGGQIKYQFLVPEPKGKGMKRSYKHD